MRNVAVLGTGTMGAGMARNLLKAGLNVTVWNRSQDKAQSLAADGARVADSPTDAVDGVDAVITMLFDGDSVAGVMDQALDSAPGGVLWAQMTTVGVPDAGERLPGIAEKHGAGFLDAPVLGTRGPAEQGALVVLVGGPSGLQDGAAPLFDAVGSRTVRVGERPGDATRLKLVINSWVLMLTAGTAQSVAMAEGLGLDPALFLETIGGTPTDSPYAHMKGKAMIERDYTPAFGLSGALKDAGLIVDAMRASGVDPSVTEAVRARLGAAADAGYGSVDMAAILESLRA